MNNKSSSEVIGDIASYKPITFMLCSKNGKQRDVMYLKVHEEHCAEVIGDIA